MAVQKRQRGARRLAHAQPAEPDAKLQALASCSTRPRISFPPLPETQTTGRSSGSRVQVRNITKEVGCGHLLRLQYQPGMFNQDLGPSSLGHTASPLSSDLFKQHACRHLLSNLCRDLPLQILPTVTFQIYCNYCIATAINRVLMISINTMDSEEHRLFSFSYGNVTCYATVFGGCTEQAETASVKNCVLHGELCFETVTQVLCP